MGISGVAVLGVRCTSLAHSLKTLLSHKESWSQLNFFFSLVSYTFKVEHSLSDKAGYEQSADA